MKERIRLQRIESDRVGDIERIVIERIYEPVEAPVAAPPMQHTDYDALSLEEKVRRLEVVAALYLGWHNYADPEKGVRDDCTRYWGEMDIVANKREGK